MSANCGVSTAGTRAPGKKCSTSAAVFVDRVMLSNDTVKDVHSDCRLFAESCAALNAIHLIHLQRCDRHLAGRALLSKGAHKTSQGNTGRPSG